MNFSPVKPEGNENSSLEKRGQYSQSQRRSLKNHISMYQPGHSGSKESGKVSSPNKSFQNRTITFKNESSEKGRHLPPSFVIQNTIKPITSQILNPYWKQTSEAQLIGILSDDSKYKRYLQSLQPSPDTPTPTHYLNAILTTLLTKIKENNPSISQQKGGFRIEFDKNVALENEVRIDNLKKEIAEKEKQIVRVEADYSSVVRNYVETLEEIEKYQEFENNNFQDSQY